MPTPGYKSVNLPQDLITRIDEIQGVGRWGYSSRDDFVAEAVRAQLLRLRELEVALARQPALEARSGPGEGKKPGGR